MRSSYDLSSLEHQRMIHGAAQHGARTDDDVHIHDDALQIGTLADGAALHDDAVAHGRALAELDAAEQDGIDV